MSAEHELDVLRGILPARPDRLLHAEVLVGPEHFTDNRLRTLYTLLCRYLEVAGGLPSPEGLADVLRRSGGDAGAVVRYEALAAQVGSSHLSDDSAWRWALESMRDDRAAARTRSALTEGMEVLGSGRHDTQGNLLKGHAESRAHVLAEFAAIAQESDRGHAPEGDVRDEATDILADYNSAKSGANTNGVLTSLAPLDAATAGHHRGELVLYCAYTNEGKTSFCVQLAWHAAIVQGKNVLFITTETLRSQVRRKIVSRHSRAPHLQAVPGLPVGGINSRALKDGSLGPDGESALKAVVDDLTTNSAYGRLHIAQLPRGATLSNAEAIALRQARSADVDIVVLDYLALLKSERPRQSIVQEMSDLMKDAKVFASSFNDGQGVALVSPWAMSQRAYEMARERGAYTLANLADTSEAEKSADLIVSFLSVPEVPGDLRVQVLKNRDGEKPDPFLIRADFRTNTFEAKSTSSSIDSLIQ